MITKEELKDKIKKARKEGIEEGKAIERKKLINVGIIHVICPVCSRVSIGFDKNEVCKITGSIKEFKCLNCGKEFKGLKNNKLKMVKRK